MCRRRCRRGESTGHLHQTAKRLHRQSPANSSPPRPLSAFAHLFFNACLPNHATLAGIAIIAAAAIVRAVEGGQSDVNEVEAAGNTPLHFACYEGWLEG